MQREEFHPRGPLGAFHVWEIGQSTTRARAQPETRTGTVRAQNSVKCQGHTSVRSQPEVPAGGRVNGAPEARDQPVSSGQQKGGAEGSHVLGLDQEVTVSNWGDPWNPAALWSPAREQVQGRVGRAPGVGRDLHPAL